jgi:hypothetical protein
MVRSLHTLERYAGWPAMAEALAALRAAPVVRLDANTLAAALSAVRGADLQPLVAECFRPAARFDYAIGDVRSSAIGTTSVETSISVLRTGSGAFAAGSDTDPEPGMPLLVRFADGTQRRDWFEGRAERTSLVYTTNARLVLAAIDPDVMLVLDEDRANNTFTTTRAVRPLGVRLALHWVSWLQQMMLTYSAIV